MPNLRAPTNRELVLIGGAAAGLVVLFWLLSRNGGALAGNIAKGAVGIASGAAGGAVIGVGNVVGLPDTSDAQVVGQGRAAVAQGDWLTASLKLPAPEFLSSVWSRLTGGSSSSTPTVAAAAPGASNQTTPAPGADLDPYQLF